MIRTFACPLHYGQPFNLECVDCLAMPTVLEDGTLVDSKRAATTEYLRRWARERLSFESQVKQEKESK